MHEKPNASEQEKIFQAGNSKLNRETALNSYKMDHHQGINTNINLIHKMLHHQLQMELLKMILKGNL